MKDGQGAALPEFVPNYDVLRCTFCGRRPDCIGVRWHGPHLEPFCLKCKGRLGSPSFWLSRTKYNLEAFTPPVKEEPGQEALFGDGA